MHINHLPSTLVTTPVYVCLEEFSSELYASVILLMLNLFWRNMIIRILHHSSTLIKAYKIANFLVENRGLTTYIHDEAIKWKHFPRYWPFLRGIHRSPVNSSNKGQWRGALMFSLICARINGWVNNDEAGYLRRHRAHYDVIIMGPWFWTSSPGIFQAPHVLIKRIPQKLTEKGNTSINHTFIFFLS